MTACLIPTFATLEAMEFEWAPAKAAANLRKYAVSFDEAVTMFANFLGVTAPDPDHSCEELRYVTSDDRVNSG